MDQNIQFFHGHIVIPFQKLLYNNRNKGMTFIRCVMEILHNARDAGANNINIKILSDTDDTPIKLLIYNDGKEIKKEEIDKILIDGYSTRYENEKNVQGKFGVGAALASQNLSNITIITSKNEDEYYDCEADWDYMSRKNTNIPYIKNSEIKNKEKYISFGDKGVLFTFESLRNVVTKYTTNDLQEILIRCIKNTFNDLGKNFNITINDITVNENFDIINKYANSNNSVCVPIYHYKVCKGRREYISIFDEKDIGKNKSEYVTYNPKIRKMVKSDLDYDKKYKFCGKSFAIGCRLSTEQVEEEINFWKSCSYYQDIKYNNLTGATFIRNNVSLNQNMERLPWDNQDYGDDQIRWKIVWNNNEDLDNIFGIQTIKIIQEDTKHNCDQNFRWTLKSVKSRGKSYISKLLDYKKSDNKCFDNEKQTKPEKNISNYDSYETESNTPIKSKNHRKGFSKNIKHSGLIKNNYRCYITGTKLMYDGKEGSIREDDHYNGDSSDNTLENYHPLTVWAHKVKTIDQNNINYHKKSGDEKAEKESTINFEDNMNEGYQKLHIKEIEYSLESLNSSYLDIQGNKKDYSKYQKEIINLFTNALKNCDPQIRDQVLQNLEQ